MTTVVSTFTAWYVKLWDSFFPGRELGVDSMPTFDGRCVCYPSVGNLRDYIAWRQVDCKSSPIRIFALPGFFARFDAHA